MSKFKVGDKVRLRDGLEAGEKYGGVVFLSDMEALKGRELTIYYISEDGDYTFDEANYYCSEEMLEKVFDDSDLLEFALNKFNIAKEELREEYKKNKIKKQELEDIRKRCNNFENYCNYRCCDDCEIHKFQKDNDMNKLDTRNCILIYEYLFGEK